jgi:hypothetical protein
MSLPWAINAELRSRDASLLKRGKEKMLISKNFLDPQASYKPSYLTSWSHSGRTGTALPAVGMQG